MSQLAPTLVDGWIPGDKPWYGSVGKEIGREAKRQLDYGKMRRQIAKHLGVDPSTSNPLLRERLDTLAWAAVAGNLSAGTALDAVGGTAAEVISVGGRLNQLVWELDEENLRERNRERLSRWCSDDFALETVSMGVESHGRAETEQQLELFFAAFPDYGVTMEGLTASNGVVTCWGGARMTWKGAFLGHPPTGQYVWKETWIEQ